MFIDKGRDRAAGHALLHPAVRFFPVSHPHHENEEDLVPNLIDHAVVLPRPDISKVPLSGGSDFHAVGQVSVSKFPHEVAKRNGSLLFRLFQGGAGVFEIDSVHAGWLDAGFPA